MVSSRGDPYEREADLAADDVMRMAEPTPVESTTAPIQRQCASCENEERTWIQTKHIPSGHSDVGVDAGTAVHSATRGGTLLPSEIRSYFEPRFGHDFSQVRVHADDEAAHAARTMQARAFTMGRDIVFDSGRYAPATGEGKRLLAHELTHVVQQGASTQLTSSAPSILRQANTPPAIQRQEAESQPVFTAQALLGLSAGSRVVITRSMADIIFGLLSSSAPDVAASLSAVSGQTATIATATDGIVEIRLDQPASLPASGDTPERSIRDLKITLRRTSSGHFDFVIAGREGDQGQAAMLYQETDLTPSRAGNAVVLAAGSEPHLRLTPASSPTEAANIEAFTAPYLVGQPSAVRALAPASVGLVSVTGLPSVAPGTPAAQAAVQRIIDRSAAQRTEPRQTFTVGTGIAGGTGGTGVHPLLRSSWRYSFQPSSSLGSLVQVPLQVDLMYAPTASVLGAVSTGIGTSLSALRIPVNVRLTGGIGGGVIEGEPLPDGSVPSRPAFGPTLGVAAGFEHDWFRVELRYDQLFNVLPGSHVPTGSLNLGAAF